MAVRVSWACLFRDIGQHVVRASKTITVSTAGLRLARIVTPNRTSKRNQSLCSTLVWYAMFATLTRPTGRLGPAWIASKCRTSKSSKLTISCGHVELAAKSCRSPNSGSMVMRLDCWSIAALASTTEPTISLLVLFAACAAGFMRPTILMTEQDS